MIALIIALVCVTATFAFACVRFRRNGKSFEGMLCKFLASLGFISTALIGYCVNPADTLFFVLVCFGLLFGLMGDVLLGLKEIAPTFRSKLILFGTISFLIGHLFYISAFWHMGGSGLIPICAGIVGVIVAVILAKALKMMVDKKFLIIISVYFGLLIFKVGQTSVMLFKNFSVASLILLLGCICFTVSDICLGLVYFTPMKKKNLFVTIELASYYPAQLLTAFALYFINR